MYPWAGLRYADARRVHLLKVCFEFPFAIVTIVFNLRRAIRLIIM